MTDRIPPTEAELDTLEQDSKNYEFVVYIARPTFDRLIHEIRRLRAICGRAIQSPAPKDRD
jgi:hypothetical protein